MAVISPIDDPSIVATAINLDIEEKWDYLSGMFSTFISECWGKRSGKGPPVDIFGFSLKV